MTTAQSVLANKHARRAIALVGATILLCVLALPAYACPILPDFTLNWWIVPTPDDYDFFWRPGLTDNVYDDVLPQLGRNKPSDYESWVSLVKPATTFYLYDPAPASKGDDWDFGFAGAGYHWYPVPLSCWDFGDGDSHLGFDIFGILLSWHRFVHSSYGQSEHNPRNEPAYLTRTTAIWAGYAYAYAWDYSAWTGLGETRTKQHAVAVRQVQPVSLGF